MNGYSALIRRRNYVLQHVLTGSETETLEIAKRCKKELTNYGYTLGLDTGFTTEK